MATTTQPGSFGTGSGGTGGAGSQADLFPTLSTGNVASQAELAALNGPDGMSAAQFMATTGVTSTELSTYQTNGQLNQNAYELLQYVRADPISRQQLQQQMVDATMLPATKATGLASDGLTAFKAAINAASSAGMTVENYLSNAQNNGIAGVEQTALGNITTAQASLEHPAAVQASMDNPTTITADVQAAWDQTLGYAADPAQIAAFVNAIHAQDLSFAESGNAATKANDLAVIATAKQANTELGNMGKDGVTTFVNLYEKALGDAGAPVAAAGPTPPPPGMTPPAGAPGAGARAAGAPSPLSVNAAGGSSPAASNLPARYGPGNPPPNGEAPVPPSLQGLAGVQHAATAAGPSFGLGGEGNVGKVTHAITDFLGRPWWDHPQEAGAVAGKSAPAAPGTTPPAGQPGSPQAPTAPGSAIPSQGAKIPGTNIVPQVGSGIFGLTPALWKAAIALFPAGKAYANGPEGAAPVQVQKSAFTALVMDLYDSHPNWATVTEILQSGSPTGTPSTTQQNVANQINSQINTDISNIGTELSMQPTVTEKFTAPDVQAEANASAKASDPIGYTAANISSAGAVLQSMIYGNPVSALQSTSDTFTGAVPLGAPDTSSAPSTASAPNTSTAPGAP